MCRAFNIQTLFYYRFKFNVSLCFCLFYKFLLVFLGKCGGFMILTIVQSLEGRSHRGPIKLLVLPFIKIYLNFLFGNFLPFVTCSGSHSLLVNAHFGSNHCSLIQLYEISVMGLSVWCHNDNFILVQLNKKNNVKTKKIELHVKNECPVRLCNVATHWLSTPFPFLL